MIGRETADDLGFVSAHFLRMAGSVCWHTNCRRHCCAICNRGQNECVLIFSRANAVSRAREPGMSARRAELSAPLSARALARAAGGRGGGGSGGSPSPPLPPASGCWASAGAMAAPHGGAIARCGRRARGAERRGGGGTDDA